MALKDELIGVLSCKFQMSRQFIDETCTRLWKVAERVEPETQVSLCPDEDDNRVLECALEGNAAYIVTGDRHLLNLAPIEGLEILTPGAFLERFHADGS